MRIVLKIRIPTAIGIPVDKKRREDIPFIPPPTMCEGNIKPIQASAQRNTPKVMME
jgi:hypothetical protein